jgi:lipopolysaccharide transport system ATP-binding protein
MSEIAIKVENLSKRYRIGLEEEIPDTFVGAAKNFLLSPIRNFRQLQALSQFKDGSPETEDGKETGDGRRETGNAASPSSVLGPPSASEASDIIWALKDVSFEVKRGEVVGIIGRNGAGKSTLLKILSRITHPTSGRVELNGRVSSLLEVGTGFHPELTGRENIYLNGTILGMTKAEVVRKFDEIVAFSGVEKFIDTPVKRYSSGMRVRLAFSVAAHLEPEILLVDEVLAVGDIAFQKKCLGKMEKVAGEGRTVLFVSHNMSMIKTLCPEAILLEDGRLRRRDRSADVVETYLQGNTEQSGEYLWAWDDMEIKELGPLIPLSLRIIDHENKIADRVSTRNSFQIEFKYQLTQALTNLRVGITLQTSVGQWVFISYDRDLEKDPLYNREPGTYLARCTIPKNLLNNKTFILGVITGIKGAQKLYRDSELIRFSVDVTDGIGSHWGGNRGGIIRPALQWETKLVS